MYVYIYIYNPNPQLIQFPPPPGCIMQIEQQVRSLAAIGPAFERN